MPAAISFCVSKVGYLDITLSRWGLASFVGATYETVFRTLGELENENITILKEETLVSLSNTTDY
jgi:CRP-like cAMP-binding protein